MKQPLKQSAKDYIGQQQLSEQQLEKFERLLETNHRDEKPEDLGGGLGESVEVTRNHIVELIKTRRAFIATAASVVLAITVSLVYFPANNDIYWQISDEVARNHIKMKPLEIRTQDLDELRNYFTELDFSVARSRVFEQSNNVKNRGMLGARYCSIQGITAAQLRYQNKAGKKVTLYEVPYDSRVFGLLPNAESGDVPLHIFVRGLSVSLWVEKGLLMVAAEEAP